MTTVSEAWVTLRPDLDKFSGEALGMLGRIGGGLAKGAAIAFAGIGTAAAAGMGLAITKAGDLEQAVANISTIKPTIDNSQVLASLNEMSRRIPQSAAQLGTALYDVFSSVDVSAEQGLALVEKFAKGAIGASTDAQTFGTAAMGVMNAYGLAVEDADHISDVFFNTVARGVVTGPELAASLGTVSKAAQNAGLDIDELGAFIVGVTQAGGVAAENMNDLQNMFAKFTTSQAQNAFRDLGIATVDSTGAYRSMTDIFSDLKVKVADMTEAQRANALQKIFPDQQAQRGADTILKQFDKVNAALDANRSAVGVTETAYQKMSSTFNSQSAILKNTFDSLLITVGAKLLPAITPLITAFAQWLPEAMAAAEAKIQELQPVFATLGEGLGLVGGTLKGIFNDLKGVADVVLPPLVTAFQFLAANWESVVFTMKAAILVLVPAFVGLQGAAIVAAVATAIAFAPVILALAAVGVAVFLLHSQWGTMVAGVTAATEAWGAIFAAVGDAIGAKVAEIGAMFATVGEAIGAMFSSIGTAVSGGLATIGSTIQSFVDSAIALWETFTSNPPRMLGVMIGLLIGGLLNLAKGIGDFATNAAETIGQWIADTAETIGDFFTALPGRVGGWLAEVRANIGTFAANAKDTVGQFVSNIRDTITEFFSALPGSIGTWLGDVIGRFQTWRGEAVSATSSMVDGVGTTISSFFAGLPGRMSSFAVQAVQGLINGFGSMVGAVRSAVYSFFSGIVDGVKAALGIRSPSAVFASIGGDMMRGLAQGIEAMARLPEAALDHLDLRPPPLASIGGPITAGSAFGGAASLAGAGQIDYDRLARAMSAVQLRVGVDNNIALEIDGRAVARAVDSATRQEARLAGMMP